MSCGNTSWMNNNKKNNSSLMTLTQKNVSLRKETIIYGDWGNTASSDSAGLVVVIPMR